MGTGEFSPWTANPLSDSFRANVSLEMNGDQDAMSVTINLNPEIEAGLQARAESEGLTLDQFVSRQLETLARANRLPAHSEPSRLDTADQWESELDQWLDSFPQHPLLSEEAMKRENWYPDRW
jgi:hypothetical protein